MPIRDPVFPNNVWDGLASDERSGSGRSTRSSWEQPDPVDHDQIVAEIIAIQEALLAGLFGGVSGPAVSTNNAIARWNGTDGKNIQDSSAFINDAGLISIASLAPKVARTAVSNNTAAMGLAHKYAVTNTATPITITISASDISGVDREFIIKDETGGAGTNNITIVSESPALIDGQSQVQITVGFGGVRLYSDGTDLFSF